MLGTPSRSHGQGRSAAASDSEDAAYSATLREAVAEFSAGHFSEARTLLEQAHALRPSARTLRGLGLAAYELRHYTQAEVELAAALRDTRNPLDAEQRHEVESALQKARRYIGTLAIATTPEGASLLLDGRATDERTLRLDAGDHVVAAAASGHETLTQRVTVIGGRTTTVRLSLVPLELSPEHAAQAGGLQAQHAADTRAGVASDTGDSMFESWWFWTAVSAVVIAGASAAVVVALDSNSSPSGYEGNGGSLQAP